MFGKTFPGKPKLRSVSEGAIVGMYLVGDTTTSFSKLTISLEKIHLKNQHIHFCGQVSFVRVTSI